MTSDVSGRSSSSPIIRRMSETVIYILDPSSTSKVLASNFLLVSLLSFWDTVCDYADVSSWSSFLLETSSSNCFSISLISVSSPFSVPPSLSSGDSALTSKIWLTSELSEDLRKIYDWTSACQIYRTAGFWKFLSDTTRYLQTCSLTLRYAL